MRDPFTVCLVVLLTRHRSIVKAAHMLVLLLFGALLLAAQQNTQWSLRIVNSSGVAVANFKTARRRIGELLLDGPLLAARLSMMPWAKNQLENYAYSMRNSISDEKLQGKLDPSDKETIEKAVAETTAWLDAHEGASTAEIEAKKKELENVCNPIMMKLYGQSGSGIPSDEPSADGGAGPTIDEVD